MALPLSGIMKASMIREELKETGTWRAGSDSSRKLAKVPNGTIKFSDFYGKSFADTPEDFWIEGELYKGYNSGAQASVDLNVSKLPDFLPSHNFTYTAWVDIPGYGTEELMFRPINMFDYEYATVDVYDKYSGTLLNKPKAGVVTNIGKRWRTVSADRQNVAMYIPNENDVRWLCIFDGTEFNVRRDVKIHIKLSNSLYYKLLGFVSSCLSSLFGGEHYGIA